MTLYENIKRLRLNRKLSQSELARLVGYSNRTTIAKIEAGKIDIPQSKIVEFAKALHVDPISLMGLNSNTASSSEQNATGPHVKTPNANLMSKDERDIQKKLQSILDDLDSSAAISFYNGDQEMDEDTKNLLRISLENSIRLAKERAKQKFTPNKYKNK